MRSPGTSPVRRAAVAALAALIAVAPASAFEKVRISSGREIEALPGQVIVRYRSGSEAEGAMRIQDSGAKERKSIGSLGLHVVSTPPGVSVEAYLAQLRSDPNIEFAEPNGVVRALAFPDDPPNDPQFGSQYALTYGGAASINVKGAWQITTGAASVIVAVVDTGVNQTHSDLSGQLVTGEKIEIDWLNNGNCTDTPQNNSALNGVGPDQCGGTSTPPDHDPEDDNSIDPNTGNPAVPPVFHGTHVSGIIAAKTNNGTDIAGIA
ncbi:MAG: S8 family serine peptidase, partial [Elusimicrobia bacterium]|nr:S8 family serine peptidase [Elusimicrobiota bacterium]